MVCAMHRETRLRSLAKSLSWRFTGTVITTLVVWAFTGRAVFALTVGGTDCLVKVLVYFAHERVWDRVRFGRYQAPPAVIWFTGLPGSGKSTVADAVHQALAAQGLRVERLDGDSLRHLFPSTGFTREDRDLHIRRVGHLASCLEKQGVYVVASFVSPYREARGFVRALCAHFVEVHVACPLAVCEQRDPKGLYAKARRGEIRNFTGVDDPYEPPEQAELTIDTSAVPVEAALATVLGYLDRHVGY